MLHHNEIYYVFLLLSLLITFKSGQTVRAQSSRQQDYGSPSNSGISSSSSSSSSSGSGEGDGGGGGGGGGGVGEIIAPRAAAINSHEPSCEELRAMWRFSKRQSRAAEITNEIPTYRDPFAYNVWDFYYPTTRSLGGGRINARYKDHSRPVYGKILIKEPPPVRLRDLSYDDLTRIAQETKQTKPKFRYSGSTNIGNQNMLTPQRGSFQRLKELIWTERARELAQQRKAEEMAARAAVLREITNGHGYASPGFNRADIQQQKLTQPLYPTSKLDNGGMRDTFLLPDLVAPGHHNNNVDGNVHQIDMVNEPVGQRDNNQYRDDTLAYTLVQNPSQLQTFYSSPYSRQPMSHFRERNRAALRHEMFDMSASYIGTFIWYVSDVYKKCNDKALAKWFKGQKFDSPGSVHFFTRNVSCKPS